MCVSVATGCLSYKSSSPANLLTGFLQVLSYDARLLEQLREVQYTQCTLESKPAVTRKLGSVVQNWQLDMAPMCPPSCRHNTGGRTIATAIGGLA